MNEGKHNRYIIWLQGMCQASDSSTHEYLLRMNTYSAITLIAILSHSLELYLCLGEIISEQILKNL